MATVDVFIPCYNAERFLQQTIDSIKKQTYQDYRVIIVDDGSTDKSMEILQKYALEDSRVQIYRNEENKGVAYTRNRGLSLCDSKYMAFMDADDIMPEYRLQREVEYMEEHPECDVVSGNYQLMDEAGNAGAVVKLGEKDTKQVYAALFFENVIANATAMIRIRSLIEKSILHDESFVSLSDYKFWTEFMIKKAEMHILDEVLLRYRIVQSGVSRTNSDVEKIERRNSCFNQIHQRLLEEYHIKLKPKELDAYMNFTNEVVKNRKEKRKNFYVFHCMVWKLKSQNPFRSNEFIVACNQFKRKFYKI